MASNATQLQLVRGIAHSREQNLAAEVGDLMRKRASAVETVQRLQGYLHEYRSEQSAQGARSMMDIENERRFVNRLNLALKQQSTHAQQLEASVSAKMQLWQREHANLQALDKLLAQRAQAGARVQDRKEQKESDARSVRAFNEGVSR